MRLLLALFVCILSNVPFFSYGQTATIEGYVFEAGNRGYLNVAKVEIKDKATKAIYPAVFTNKEGVFTVDLPLNKEFLLEVNKDLFNSVEKEVSTMGLEPGKKVFLKYEMKRVPGYIFDVTIAEKKQEDKVTDAITGARIEVYNNTKEEEVLVIENHPGYTFKTHFEDGNHYTVLLRKEGFFNKRMEAFVNVEGCILCFEGVGEVKPSDVLTEGNNMGTLLANVEMTPVELNKGIKIENIYYDLAKANIRRDAKPAVEKLAFVLKTNPGLLVELGSHTDARGKDPYNLKLSEDRAQSVVDFLVENGIDRKRLIARGYGETDLVNSCKNGVKCSERKHQQNRRTEMKIVGYVDDPFKNKSLSKILEEEKFEKMLAELGTEGEIKIAAGEELPDELKNDSRPNTEPAVIEETIISTSPNYTGELKPGDTTISPSTGSVASTETEVELFNTNVQPTAPTNSTTMADLESAGSTSITNPVTVPDPIEENKVPIDEISNEFPGNSSATEVLIETPVVAEDLKSEFTKTKIEEPKEEVAIELDPIMEPVEFEEKEVDFDGSETGASTSQVFGEFPLDVKPVAKGPKLLPKGYTGYRVEFFNSSYELPRSHEIFSNHGNITMEQKKDGNFGYLLGDFNEWRDANRFLSTIISNRYSGASVVRYKKGNRIAE